jgi:hypothetical protein
MIALPLIMLVAGATVAEAPASATEEAIYWDDYAPCGLVSLYLICQLQEKTVAWEEVKKLVGQPRADGELNFENLATAASQLGMRPVGLEVGREALKHLPMPAIIQVHDARYPDEIPHFLVLLRPEVDGVWLLDAPYAAYFLPEERFQQTWTGKVLIFARDEQVEKQIRGLAYGSTGLQWIAWGLIVIGMLLLTILGLIGWWRRSRIRHSLPRVATNGASHRRFAGILCKKSWLFASSLLFLMAAAALLLFWIFHHDQDVPARCEFDKRVMELGELTPGEHSVHVQIQNTGNHPLHITKAVSNCTCCAIVQSPALVEPGQNAMLDVRLTVIPGPRSIRLTVESNDPDGPKHILLLWQGGAKPILVPRWITSANVPLDRPYKRTIRLIYPGGKSALVPHLKSCECDRRGVEAHEGRNDPTAIKFTASGLLTNILGEMELHLCITPPTKPERLQTTCKLALSYGNDTPIISLPLNLSFSGGQLSPDVTSVTFSAGGREELVSQERFVRVADQDPRGEIEVSDVPSWLTCEIKRKTQNDHVLLLKVVRVPSVLPLQHTIHIARKGGGSFQSDLRVNVMSGSRF